MGLHQMDLSGASKSIYRAAQSFDPSTIFPLSTYLSGSSLLASDLRCCLEFLVLRSALLFKYFPYPPPFRCRVSQIAGFRSDMVRNRRLVVPGSVDTRCQDRRTVTRIRESWSKYLIALAPLFWTRRRSKGRSQSRKKRSDGVR